MQSKQSHLAWLILFMLISTALASSMLNADILFVDEYWSLRNSGGIFGPLDAAGIWERTATVDPGGMGVLYHWLLAGWMYFIGASVFSVRVFSLLSGILAIAVIYRFGRDTFSPQIGLFAAGVLATSAFFIDYLHEARAYTLLVLFTILAVYCYQRVMSSKNPSWFWYAGLSLMLAALAYTHYVALTMGLVLGVYHLTRFDNSRKWWLVVVAMAIGGALFLPWLTVTIEVIQRGSGDTNRQNDSMNTVLILQNLLHTVSNANLALLALAAFFSFKQWKRETFLAWTWLVVSILAVIVINALIPFMVHLRYLLFVFPAFALMIAIGMERMKSLSLAVFIVWIGAGIYQTVNRDFIDEQFGQIYRAPADGFDAMLDILNTRAEDDDVLLLHVAEIGLEPLSFFQLDYYFKDTDLVSPDVQVEQIERINNSFAGGDVEYLADVETALSGSNIVWTAIVPELDTTQRSDVLAYVLATQYSHCDTVLDNSDMQVNLYARVPETGRLAIYGDDIVELYDLEHGLITEDSLEVVLGWWASNAPVGLYSVGLHVYDSAGNLVRQQDYGLPDQRPFTCTTGNIDLSDLPAGDYTLRITVYEWQTGNQLLIEDENPYVDLRTITLE